MLGVIIAQLYRLQHSQSPDPTFGYFVLSKPISSIFHVSAICVALLGSVRFFRQQHAMAIGKVQAGGFELMIIGVYVLMVSALVRICVHEADMCNSFCWPCSPSMLESSYIKAESQPCCILLRCTTQHGQEHVAYVLHVVSGAGQILPSPRDESVANTDTNWNISNTLDIPGSDDIIFDICSIAMAQTLIGCTKCSIASTMAQIELVPCSNQCAWDSSKVMTMVSEQEMSKNRNSSRLDTPHLASTPEVRLGLPRENVSLSSI